MSKPKVYADFQNLDVLNRLRLTCVGTVADLARQRIELHEGLALTFYMDDADDQGEADELRTDGVVHYDKHHRAWVESVDWSAIRHESDERTSTKDSVGPPHPEPMGENGPMNHASGPLSPAPKPSRRANGSVSK
jgi:hypothetical protein